MGGQLVGRPPLFPVPSTLRATTQRTQRTQRRDGTTAATSSSVAATYVFVVTFVCPLMTLCREGRRSYYGRDPGDRIGISFAKLAAAFKSICSIASTREFPSEGLVKSGMHQAFEILSTYEATHHFILHFQNL